ncbi:MAG: hypothetical protein ACJAQ0_000142 [Dasania sp.]
MVDINKLSSALSSILGTRGSGGDESIGYDKLLTDAGVNIDSLSTVADDKDLDELSDVELQEIAQQLSEHIKGEKPSKETVEIHEIIQAIHEYIVHDDEVSIEGDDHDKGSDVISSANLLLDIHEDLADGELDSLRLKTQLTAETNIPAGFATLDPAEQAAILELYHNEDKDTLFDDAIKSLSSVAQADLLATLSSGDFDISFSKVYDKINNKKYVITALFYIDGIIENYPDTASQIATDLINAIGDDEKKTLMQVVRRNTRLSSRVEGYKSGTTDSIFSGSTDYNNNTEVYYKDLVKALPEVIKPTSGFDTWADNIIKKFNDIESITDLTLKDIQKLDTADTLDEYGTLEEVFDVVLDKIGDMNQESINSLVQWLNQQEEEKPYIKGEFLSSLKNNPAAQLLLNYDEIKDSNVPSSVYANSLIPSTSQIDDVKGDLHPSPEPKDFDVSTVNLGTYSIATLGYAFPDISDAKAQKNIIDTMLKKASASTSTDGVNDIKQLLFVFNNIPELRDAVEAILESDPDNQLANLLTYQGGEISEANVGDIQDAISNDSSFSSLMIEAQSGSIDKKIGGNVGDFKALIDSIPLKDDSGDDIDPADSIKDFFAENSDSKTEIFTALADGNSALYDAVGGDITEIMEFFWEYLQDAGSSEQKEFLSKIPPYSPIHLSLMETIAERRNDGDFDRKDNRDRDEIRYLENLEKLSDAIKEDSKTFSGVNLKYLFPRENADIDADTVIKDIFGNVENIYDDNGSSDVLSDFIQTATSGTLSEADTISFLKNLSNIELSEFTKALTSDASPILALLKQEDGNELVDEIMSNLFKGLASNDLPDYVRLGFLENIDSDSDFFDYMQNVGTEFSDAIEDGDFTDFTSEEIQDFIKQDFPDITKLWYGSAVSNEYLRDLSKVDDSKDIRTILDNAEDEGVLENVLFSLASDKFDDYSADFYTSFFKHLRSDRDAADIFFSSIDPNSFLGRSLVKLIEEEEKPFTRISYDIDPNNGKMDFGNDQSRLMKILSDRKMVGANILSDTIDTIKDTYQDAVGDDNRGILKLIQGAQENNLNNNLFADIFNIDSDDTVKAEEILEFIADDNSILYKDLDAEQLEIFLDKFLDWIATQDDDNGLLEFFGGILDDDTILFKALIKAGADLEDYEEGDYKKFIKGARQTEDAADFIKNSLNHKLGDNKGLGFISEQLRGLKGRDIDDKIDEIVEFAVADPDIFEELTAAIASGDQVILGLTKEQAEKLIEAVMDEISDQDPEEDEDISVAGDNFLKNIQDNSVIADYIKQDYPILADYFGFGNGLEDPDYDDRDIANELDDLLSDKKLIDSYAKRSNGQNEIDNRPNRRSNNNNNNNANKNDDYSFKEDDDYGFKEDDDYGFKEDDTGIYSTSSSSNTSSQATFSSATDAALANLGRYIDVAGEPNYETGIFTTYFLENNSVKSLANLATSKNFNTQSVIGLLQYIPLSQQADFIRHYMSSNNISDETKNYLLGRLLIMITNDEVGGRTIDKIFEDAGISSLTPNIIEDIMESWAESMGRHTTASISAIDDTYEKVVKDTSILTNNANPSSNASISDNINTDQRANPPQNPYAQVTYAQNPYAQSPYAMGYAMTSGPPMLGNVSGQSNGSIESHQNSIREARKKYD